VVETETKVGLSSNGEPLPFSECYMQDISRKRCVYSGVSYRWSWYLDLTGA
jgi:hypothetical protein